MDGTLRAIDSVWSCSGGGDFGEDSGPLLASVAAVAA